MSETAAESNDKQLRRLRERHSQLSARQMRSWAADDLLMRRVAQRLDSTSQRVRETFVAAAVEYEERRDSLR